MRRSRFASFIITVAFLPWTQVPADTVVVTPVAVSGQTAPVGGVYSLFGGINIDNLRRVTFTASLSKGRIGIFRTSRGMTMPLLLAGQAAPSDAGSRFTFIYDAASNTRGDLAFIAEVVSPRRTGVFLMRDGVITTLALAGSSAPTRLDEYFAGFGQIRIPDSGDVYFAAALTDQPSFGSPAGEAIIRASGGALQGVVAPGERYMGEREIDHTLQFHVNEAGTVVTLVGSMRPPAGRPGTTRRRVLVTE